jgi:hypothetical protein
MSGSRSSGDDGESVTRQLLVYAGWEIIEDQPLVHGHRLDFRAKHPLYGEALFEVKVWATKSGRDTVKKAIGDAYDLQAAGEQTPYVLVLSHELTGLHHEMLLRANHSGAIARVLVLTLVDM